MGQTTDEILTNIKVKRSCNNNQLKTIILWVFIIQQAFILHCFSINPSKLSSLLWLLQWLPYLIVQYPNNSNLHEFECYLAFKNTLNLNNLLAADYRLKKNSLNLNLTDTLNLARKNLVPYEAKTDCRATGVLQLVLDSYEITKMLMKNLKSGTCHVFWIWPEKTWYHTKQKQIVRSTRVLQSVMDSCEIITMLIRNHKNYESKKVTQTVVPFEML